MQEDKKATANSDLAPVATEEDKIDQPLESEDANNNFVKDVSVVFEIV